MFSKPILLSIAMLCVVSCDKPRPQTATDARPSTIPSSQAARGTSEITPGDVVGRWKSPNLGLDFPIWMVDTYSADGTMTTDFYSEKTPGQPVHHAQKRQQGIFHIENGAMVVGHSAPDGKFEAEGQPRWITRDKNGRVESIGEFKRVE